MRVAPVLFTVVTGTRVTACLPASHQCTAGKVGMGEGNGCYIWFVASKRFRMMSGRLWIMNVRHKVLRFFKLLTTSLQLEKEEKQ